MTRIAILQAQTGIDPKRNAAALVEAIARARDEGAEMLFTPEMSGLLDRDRKRAAAQLCSQADDPVLAAVREAAASANIWVHLGSLALRGEGDRLANRGFVIDCEGAIRASYDKLHLFDVDLASGESWRESAVYAPGTRSVIVEGTPVGRLGLTVCYDLRFPALFAALAEAGAETIAVPSAFTVPTGEAHWHVLLRARAGQHEDGRATYGHSLVVDPWGAVIADAGPEPGLVFAEIDLGRIAEVRSRVPALSHRRPIPPVEIVAPLR